MNIFNFLNRSGKIALSAMQAVGLTAVVGAAGVGAWQYLSGPADDNNAFNPAQYNPGEVVYVAGANTGGYASTSYGSGVPGSSVQVSAQTLKRLDRQAQAEQIAREMEEESSQMYASDSGPGAYQMGATEGLGMGANYVADANSNSSPMGVMQQSMAGMQDMIAKAQQQVSGKAGPQPATGEKAGALGSVTPNWSRGGAGGTAGGSSFALQDSGKNNKGDKGTRGRRGSGSAADAQDALSAAQAQAAGMLEGARIRGKSSFGPMETLGANRDASIDKARRGRNGKNDLEFIQKRSADAAANRHRAANEGSRAFLASTQVSGGMRITAENVTTGQGQGSKDFDTDTEVNLRGIRTWGDNIETQEIQHNADRQSLLWFTVGTVVASLALMLTIALTKNIGPYGWIAAAAATVVLAGLLVVLALKIARYAESWGWEGMTIATTAVAGILALGAVAAWTFGQSFFSKMAMKIAGSFGFGGKIGTILLGGISAAGGAGAAVGGGLSLRK